MKKIKLLTLAMMLGTTYINAQDPFQWLEEVEGKKATEWVADQNKKTFDVLMAEPAYQSIYNKSLEIYNSTERLATPMLYGSYVYNFWQDKDHVRGVWRRCTKESYKTPTPQWEVMLDLDALSTKENAKWVYKGASGLYPDYNRFLVYLSRGGGDAVEIREYDAASKSFLKDGFFIPEGKGNASYLDANTLIVSADFGKESMTTSGYPNQVKLWARGTALKEAKLIHTGNVADVSSGGYVMHDRDKHYLFIRQGTSFYTEQSFVLIDGNKVKLDLPDDANISSLLNNQLVVELKSDWKVNGQTYPQGSLVSLDFAELIKGNKKIERMFEPDEFTSISEISSTKNYLLVNSLTNVRSELTAYKYNNGAWTKQKVQAPDFGTIYISTSDEFTDEFYFNYQNFLTPASLYYCNAADGGVKVVKSLPAFFDGSKYEVKQYKAKAPDGTMVPYFVVASKNLQLNGNNPTLIYAYGGFEVPSLPRYSAINGNAWLENGGVYVLANIRGGGEFGPKWHQAGLKEKRQTVFNDFYAVAEDLIGKKITSSQHLGIMGGSNGGLLMGVSFTQRPELYNAVVCGVPLLDMERFNKLLAGASWMGEYGNPDKPEEWEFIKKYSPYHNLKRDTKYPEVFFFTSTRDDRVHPGHARKMVAKMQDMGYKVYYYENTEGGHAGASTNEQSAKLAALEFVYLLKKLK